MDRLTTNKDVSEMSMIELAYNSCYAKDGRARYRDYDLNIDARELARKLLKEYADGDDAFICDEDFDECMLEYLQYGMDSMEGLIALFYRNLWAMADLRERLKCYEDTGLTPEEIMSGEIFTGWIPVEERLPEDDKYILVSFENYSVADIARYEMDENGGAFYPGDEDKSYVSFGLFVNAWMPLPEPYRQEKICGK